MFSASASVSFSLTIFVILLTTQTTFGVSVVQSLTKNNFHTLLTFQFPPSHQCKPKLSQKNPVALGYAGDHFIVITVAAAANDSSKEGEGNDGNALCLFQLPTATSVVDGKYYLSEGKPLEEVWPGLKEPMAGDQYTGLLMSGSSKDHYLMLDNIGKGEKTGKNRVMFHLEQKKVVVASDDRLSMVMPKPPVSAGPGEPMTAYGIYFGQSRGYLLNVTYEDGDVSGGGDGGGGGGEVCLPSTDQPLMFNLSPTISTYLAAYLSRAHYRVQTVRLGEARP